MTAVTWSKGWGWEEFPLISALQRTHSNIFPKSCPFSFQRRKNLYLLNNTAAAVLFLAVFQVSYHAGCMFSGAGLAPVAGMGKRFL